METDVGLKEVERLLEMCDTQLAECRDVQPLELKTPLKVDEVTEGCSPAASTVSPKKLFAEGAATPEAPGAALEGAAESVVEVESPLETAGAVVEDAAASVQGAAACVQVVEDAVVALTPERPQQALQPLKRQKVQYTLGFFCSPSPSAKDLQPVQVQALNSRHRIVQHSPAEARLAEEAAAEKRTLAEEIADAMLKKEAHLQVVGADGRLAGVTGALVLGPQWAPPAKSIGNPIKN